MPKFVRARPPLDESENKKVRRLASARHAPADWSQRARIITLSWGGLTVSAIAGQLGCHPNRLRDYLAEEATRQDLPCGDVGRQA